jgi:ferric-dicitrate binding protein FerR (iron transport regulator)
MQYEDYKVEDFLYDEFFVRWIKNPGPETEHFWESWIEKNQEKIQTINEAREIINSIKYKNRYEPSEEEYNETLEHILKQQTSWTQLDSYKKNDRLTSMVRYAAVLLTIISFSALMVYLNIENTSVETNQSAELIEKQNPKGQKSTFKLEDGTVVKLNAGSKLTFKKVFAGHERKVILEGEAFFDVKRHENRPFIVETKGLTTTVLGTSFNIKSYQEEGKASVAVASGKVKVMKSHEPSILGNQYILLNKNQMVTYNLSDNSITKNESISEEVFSWKDNIIHFNQTEFNFIVSTLERWYGVEFIIESKKSFAGRFNAKYYDEPLDLILEGLKGEYDFKYRIEEEKVYIY